MKYLLYLLLSTKLVLTGTFLYAQLCPPNDVPDMFFQDINGDGIDGDTMRAIFVSDAFGNDGNPGTLSLPVKTIDQGIVLGFAAGKDVYVAKGTYILTAPIVLKPGVGLYGLFDDGNNWSRSLVNSTTITGIPNPVEAINISTFSTMEGFNIVAAPAIAPGGSSYGIRIVNCTGIVNLTNNTIKAGNAAAGNAGASGSNGSAGANGQNGGFGSCDGNISGSGGIGGNSPCNRTGGNGGNGGPEGAFNGLSGMAGVGGAAGGNGGTGGNPGGPGVNGAQGATATSGTNGAQATNGTIQSGLFLPAAGNDGTNGGNGNGGGGGGGGGGQGCTFCDDGTGNGGGGGGAGGCGGQAGKGGAGGGASIAVLAIQSKVNLDNNTLIAGNGGNGGAGGSGGNGGNGGTGGAGGNNCTSEVGRGGNGGNGSAGGSGGNGSGGSGGISVGLYNQGSTITYGINTIMVGKGGAPGAGGLNILGAAPAGKTGDSSSIVGNILPLATLIPGGCAPDITITEPAGTDSTVFVKVFLTNPAPSNLSLEYSTFDGTAISGIDYVATTGNLNFLKGEIMKNISVKILRNNALPASDKSFSVVVKDMAGATTVQDTSVITILEKYVTTGTADRTSNFSMMLLQNIPNPFSDKTTIKYYLPSPGKTVVTIFDMQGKIVAVPVNEIKNAGEYQFSFYRQELASGIYYCYLIHENGMLVHKLIIQ